jgi:TonB family protein
MMKLILISLLIPSFSNGAFSQTDTVLVYLDYYEKPCTEDQASKYAVQVKENNRWKKVVYDITDDKPEWAAYFSNAECTLFEGAYNKFNKSGKPTVFGRYTQNKKSGTWRYFADNGRIIDSAVYRDGFIYGLSLGWYENGAIKDSTFFKEGGKGAQKGFWVDGTIRETGNYIAGKKEGQWTYYFKTGSKSQVVNYIADSAISYTCFDEAGHVKTVNCFYEKEASFKGGDAGWRKYLTGKLGSAKYPKNYLEGNIHGQVNVRFVVESDGRINDVRIEKSLHPDLDKIALDIIQNSPRWEPAVQYNRFVKAYLRQPITFAALSD